MITEDGAFEQAKARLAEIVANRPKVYKAWEDTWTTLKENPTAYEEACAALLAHDIKKNIAWEEVKRLEPPEKNT